MRDLKLLNHQRHPEGKALQIDVRVGSDILTTSLSSKTMNNYRIAHHSSSIQEINNLEVVNSIFFKNQIQLFSLSPVDCEEVLFNELPVRDPMIIRYLKFSDSVQAKSQTLILGTLNAKNKTCNSIAKYFSDSKHEIDIDGPFTLKF